jgi:signal peptidase I
MTDANAAPHRYGIVCFNDPDASSGDRLVKRVMGLPGDSITIQDGILTINGQEEYSKNIMENKLDSPDAHLRVPADRIYVMGDNRNNSEDSRVFGPVPYGNVTGVVMCIVWPPKHWGRPQKLH